MSSNVLFYPTNGPKPKDALYSYIKQRKAENPHICETGVSTYLAVSLKKWLK